MISLSTGLRCPYKPSPSFIFKERHQIFIFGLLIVAYLISVCGLRDCMVSKKKDCEAANSELYKPSDAKGLGADAKIIVALLKQQPLKRIVLCEKAGINESTFSRYKRLLFNKGILKESTQGFSLWYYKESPILWDVMLSELQKAGGHLTKVKLERLLMEKQDRVTRTDNKIYDNPVSIEGIIILKGAAKLEIALRLGLPNQYQFYAITKPSGGFFVTPASVKRGDRFVWSDKMFEADYVEQFFDGETLSYTLAMLKQHPS
jgi:hypothetical protein